MQIDDVYREEWIRDISAVMGNTSTTPARDFHALLKNLACHTIIEQLQSDPKCVDFHLNMTPFGAGTLHLNEDGSFSLINFKFSRSFLYTLRNGMKAKESNLYKANHYQVIQSLKKQLDEYSRNADI